MAGGGGSWKVAYADFVTAMMAFFLVMWLASQEEKIKEAVQRTFENPFRPMTLQSTGIIPNEDIILMCISCIGQKELPILLENLITFTIQMMLGKIILKKLLKLWMHW